MDQAAALEWGVSEVEEGRGPEPADARARTYALLASLLARAPGGEALAALGAIEVPAEARRAPLAPAWEALGEAARRAEPEALAEEYQDLFVGIGRGEVVPYASWYLTGFMMDRPLAELRADLAALGIERSAGNREPEDHAAALLEAMALLVEEAPEDLAGQRRFFERHLGPWMATFFADLQQAGAARFYRAVGLLGALFLELDGRYLELED